jgi:hypothetical protein
VSGTHPTQTPLASYRDAVTGLLEAGEPFDAVEEAIDEVSDLSQEQKDALWLFAHSLGNPADRAAGARAHVAPLQ